MYRHLQVSSHLGLATSNTARCSAGKRRCAFSTAWALRSTASTRPSLRRASSELVMPGELRWNWKSQLEMKEIQLGMKENLTFDLVLVENLVENLMFDLVLNGKSEENPTFHLVFMENLGKVPLLSYLVTSKWKILLEVPGFEWEMLMIRFQLGQWWFNTNFG